MADKAFVIEKLGWYVGKDLKHDPEVKLKTLARFLQESGLTTRQLVDPALDLADDFQISSADVTERGLRFLKGGYQKWIKSIDRGGDPADASLLKRELEKLGQPFRKGVGVEIFDKAKYHADGDFPAGLSHAQAYVPGGMFVGWCALAGLLSEQSRRDFAEEYAALTTRVRSPCSLYRAFGGVFNDSHLSEQGVAFAKAYFDFEVGAYLDDYIATLAADLPSAYHVADDWDSFDRLRQAIDQRFQDWKHQSIASWSR